MIRNQLTWKVEGREKLKDKNLFATKLVRVGLQDTNNFLFGPKSDFQLTCTHCLDGSQHKRIKQDQIIESSNPSKITALSQMLHNILLFLSRYFHECESYCYFRDVNELIVCFPHLSVSCQFLAHSPPDVFLVQHPL